MKDNFIYKLVNSRLFILIIILIILVFGSKYLYNKYDTLKTELVISKQNELSLADTLRSSKNRVGDLITSKQVLITKHTNELKTLNSSLFEESKKYKGQIHELNQLLANIDNDTVIIDNTTIISLPNGTNGVRFNYSKIYDSENSRFIAGTSFFKFDSINNKIIPLSTKLTRDVINFNLTQGLRTTDDGKVEMFASSSYPGFKVKELNSVIIDPKTHPSLTKFTKQKKLRFGLYGGYGVTANISSGKVSTGPQIGAGLLYIIW